MSGHLCRPLGNTKKLGPVYAARGTAAWKTRLSMRIEPSRAACAVQKQQLDTGAS